MTSFVLKHSKPLLVILFIAMFTSSIISLILFRQETVRQSQEFKDNLVFFTAQYEREVMKTILSLNSVIFNPHFPSYTYAFLDQFDILWSRISLLTQGSLGEELSLLENSREATKFANQQLMLIDSLISGKKLLSSSEIDIITNSLEALRDSAHSLSLSSMEVQQKQVATRRQNLLEVYSSTFAFGIMALLAGCGIILIFIIQNRSLTNLRVNLERLVSERTKDLLSSNNTLLQEVSERKYIEVQLRESRQHAEQANRAKSQFLANMSHELRTPLNAIIGFADIMNSELLGPVENPRYKEYINDIHLSGAHLSALLQDILDLTKIEANEVAVKPVHHLLLDNVTKTVNLLENLRRQFDQTVEIDIPNSIEINADPIHLKQIFLNLLSNSYKYAGLQSFVSIYVETGTKLNIIVADNGRGLPASECAKVLEPFHQYRESIATSETGRSISGTGIGLSISNKLANLHGGSIKIESDVGQGTKATLILPIETIVSS